MLQGGCCLYYLFYLLLYSAALKMPVRSPVVKAMLPGTIRKAFTVNGGPRRSGSTEVGPLAETNNSAARGFLRKHTVSVFLKSARKEVEANWHSRWRVGATLLLRHLGAYNIL